MNIYYFFATLHVFCDVCFAQSQNSNSVFMQGFIFSCISVFGFLMPIIAITFNSKVLRRNKNINRPSINVVLRNKIYPYLFEIVSYFRFNTCWMMQSITPSVAKKTTSFYFRVPQTSDFPASWAWYICSFDSGFIIAPFRTMQSSFIGSMIFFTKKCFAAIQAFSTYIAAFPVWTIESFHKAFGASIGTKSLFFAPIWTSKSCSAKFTSFINHLLTLIGASRYTSQYCCSGNTGVTGCV